MSAEPRVRETVHSFGRTDALCGIVTHPPSPTGIPVVVLGAGIIHKVGPSRVSVELSRGLAARGHAVLRFDLSGIGDSPRAPEAELEEAVVSDIGDAIALLRTVTGSASVCLAGLCSGADNGFFVGPRDPRVGALALFDPTVPSTPGFVRRRRLERLRSFRWWANALSGRSLLRRLRRHSEAVRPPGYYGLLTVSPEETDRIAGELGRRGVPQLYIMSGGARTYCNSPGQIAESMPTGFREDLATIAWRPDFDHILSEPSQRRALCALIGDWLARVARDL